MKLLEVEKLTVQARLRGGTADVVQSLSFSLEAGESLAIVGESGSGKTMTANAILGLLPRNCAASGRLLLDGRNLLALDARTRRGLLGSALALVPQSGADSLTPTLTIGFQLREVLKRQGIREREAQRVRSRELLLAVGLNQPEQVQRSYPFQLSGGMAQRAALAMALAGSPRLVIADEPTRGVDDETAEQYLDSLTQNFAGAGVLLITHSLRVAARCGRVLVLRRGRAVRMGRPAAVLGKGNPYEQEGADGTVA